MSILQQLSKPKAGPVQITIAADAGMGKCHGKGTKIRMADGKIKNVEDIEVGDVLAGYGGKQPRVIGLGRGRGKLYRITPKRPGWHDPFVCNADHILSLMDHNGERAEISVADYMSLPKIWESKNKWCLHVDTLSLPKSAQEYDPYFIGLYLAEGTRQDFNLTINASDSPLIDYLTLFWNRIFQESYQAVEGPLIRTNSTNSAGDTSSVSVSMSAPRGLMDNLRDAVQSLSKNGERYIPDRYLYASQPQMAALLAGFIDGDGYKANENSWEVAIKDAQLTEQIVFLSRSLGYAVKAKKKYLKTPHGNDTHTHIVRIAKTPISLEIPLLLGRKVLNSCGQYDNSRYSFSIEELHEDDYFGFELTDDGLYQLADGTVTHNTTLAAAFPDPVIVRIEDGVASLGDNCPPVFPVADTGQMVIDQLNALGAEDHAFKTVILDSVTKLERMFEAEVVAADPKAKSINSAAGGYGAGFKAVAERHREVKALCDNLKRYVGMNVVFIAHVDAETVDLPDQEAYTRYSLRMHRHSIAHYVDDVDAVAFIKQKTFTRGEGDKKKAVTDGTRIITCYPTPSHISKNRFGIEADLPFPIGSNPLAEFIPALRTTNATNQPSNQEVA